uniref:hypothetical protein n=1 Tax=Eubacterium cellulosolvens TaxID=29322 RepID=UPI00048423FF|nr:hypothetical protein [[Eubacterium] cellulosolvens]
MRIAIVTHSSTYESRAEAVGNCFRKMGCRVTWIYSDYNHLTKQTRRKEKKDHIYMHMIPYTKNLSAKRLFSIHSFARETGRYIDAQMKGKDPFDLLYVMIPANTFVRETANLKRQYSVKVIFDLIDLWPESLPLKHLEKTPPVLYWRRLRDRDFDCADLIFTECGLYRELLKPAPELAEKMETLYWFKESYKGEKTQKDADSDRKERALTGEPASAVSSIQGTETLHVAYMGAINNIIDIPRITELLLAIDRIRPVKLHIVGEGNHAEDFIRAVEEAGISMKYYGAVYDEMRKEEILSKCSFGLNIMKPDVCVGLTMKSIEYLSHSLPLINNIRGDTERMVRELRIGVNAPPLLNEGEQTAEGTVREERREKLETWAQMVVRQAEDPEAGNRAGNAYQNLFTRERFEQTLEKAVRAHGLTEPHEFRRVGN